MPYELYILGTVSLLLMYPRVKIYMGFIFKIIVYILYPGLAVYILYVAISQNFNYYTLSSKLNYVHGIGNISQIAMYLCFMLISSFALLKGKCILYSYTVVGIILSIILHSKLIGLVISILLLGCVLKKKPNFFSWIYLLGSLIFSSTIYMGCPSSLQGRWNLLKISICNYKFHNLFGIGSKKFEAYINELFVSRRAINNVGEINHLAYNDFLQIFIEYGYLGVLCLLLILVFSMHKSNIYCVSAIIPVLLFMFPLQYHETTILFICTLFAINYNQISFEKFLGSKFNHRKFSLYCTSCLLISFFFIRGQKYIQEKNVTYLYESIVSNPSAINLIEEYKSYEGKFNNSYLYFTKLGLHLYKLNKYTEALKYFELSQSLNPSYEVYTHIGDCYYRLNNYNTAIKYYEDARLLRPKHLYPVYKITFALLKLNKEDEMKKYWDSQKGNFTVLYGPKMILMWEELNKL